MQNKEQVRIVSESEHAKIEAVSLTTDRLKELLKPIVEVLLTIDDTKVLVKVRRGNLTEFFSNLGYYSMVTTKDTDASDDTSKDNANLDELNKMDVQIMQECIINWIAEPVFKYQEAEGEGYPVELLSYDTLRLFYNAVNAVNAPKEAREILRRFPATNQKQTGKTADADAGQESSKVRETTERTDNDRGTDNDVSESGI